MTNIEQRIENVKRFIETDKATIEELVKEGFDEEVINAEREALKQDEEELEQLLKLKGEK